MPHSRLGTVLLVFVALSSASGQTSAPPTTVTTHHPLFTWNDALLGAGFVAGTFALFPLDKHYATQLQEPGRQDNRFYQDAAKFFNTTAQPGSVIIGVGLYGYGKLAKKERVADLGLHGTEALVVGALVADVLKIGFGRARPFVTGSDSTPNPGNWQFMRGRKSGDFQSFPSGHTVAGFAAAAAVTNEASRWWPGSQWYVGPVMFGGAALIGASRMYNNRHWASDVMLGAAIGTFAGNKVVRYNHKTNPNNRLDRWLLSGNVRPTANGLEVSFSFVPAFTQ